MEEFFKSLKETNPEAVAALNAAKTEEEVLEILRKNGLEVASLDELKEKIAAEGGISADDLESVAGGIGFGVCIWGGLGNIRCYINGDDNFKLDDPTCYTTGRGICDVTGDFSFCFVVGF